MDWNKLFTMQKMLDTHIEKNHNLQNKTLLNEKYLALLVELGELANETRCFKFWSVNDQIDEQAVLEEFVDGIHFILSLGIHQGLDKNFAIDQLTEGQTSNSMTEQFNLVYHLCTLFKINPNEESYHMLVKNYLQIGKMLGFTFERIEQAYYAKNEVNYIRQDEGY